MKRYKFLCGVLCLAMMVTLTGCGGILTALFSLALTGEENADADSVLQSTSQQSVFPAQGTNNNLQLQGEFKQEDAMTSISMEVEADGSLHIQRPVHENRTPMGEPDTWTIFVYMCGSDLESEYGCASEDMNEMRNASTGSNVKFVVQTGGASDWNNYVSSGKLQRYVIYDGTATLLEENYEANMGDASTLSDFIGWGVTHYGAEKMGLVLWNHGGGSINGVCYDENYYADSLTLREVDAALLNNFELMTDMFEFIGFDACLMGTIECANTLASYARYMYGSEETEPGYGWDYEAIGDYLGANPRADGAMLGRVVTDSYYDDCYEIGAEMMATFSVIDLSKIDALLIAFNDYAESLYQVTEDTSNLAVIIRNTINADNYGGNNKAEGYTNMVDLAGLVRAGADFAHGSEDVISAINHAVIYQKNGSAHKDACGLSIYYPLKIQSSTELGTFGQIAVSPYYLSYVDRAAYNAVNAGSNDYAYDNSQLMEFWGLYDYIFGEDQTYLGDIYDYVEYGDSDYWSYYDYYDEFESTGSSPFITFEQEPAIDEEGNYGFVLSEEGLSNATSVQGSVYVISDDEEDLIELGITVDILMDWETGTFYDNFYGYWFSLPDGQDIAVYMVEEGDGYDVYTCPIYLNGEEMYLRITHDYANSGAVSIDGAWNGIDENGMAGKEMYQLQTGDSIVPFYNAVSIDSDEEYTYYGQEYIYQQGDEIIFDWLPDGDYFYGFYIDDIYGDFYTTEFVYYYIIDGQVYYE